MVVVMNVQLRGIGSSKFFPQITAFGRRLGCDLVVLGRLMELHLSPILESFDGEQRATLVDELKFYLLGSFGSAQRLDYGTGHELSFLAFLGALWKLNAFEEGEERGIVVGVVQP